MAGASRAHSPVQRSLLCTFPRPEVKHPRVATQTGHDRTRIDPDILPPPQLPCMQSSHGGRLKVKYISALHPLLLWGEIEAWEEKYPAKGDSSRWQRKMLESNSLWLQSCAFKHYMLPQPSPATPPLLETHDLF